MSLLVWLPLNGNLDNWGSSPAKFSVVGSGIATATTGKTTPNSYQRTTANTNGYITSDINFTMNGDMTLACWCKVTAIGSPNTANGIITQHGHDTGGLGITIKDIGTQDFRICANTGLYGDKHTGQTDRSYHKYYGSTNIYNAWHHLCITYNSSSKQLRMYVDGKPETITFADTGAQSIAFTLSGNNTTARPFRLFDWSTDFSANGSYKPPCYLNDVRMYDHCLSAKEVKLLGQGLVAHYKLDCGGANNLLINTTNPADYTNIAAKPATNSIVYDNELKLNVFQASTTATGETYIYSSRTPVIAKSSQYTFSCDVWVNDKVKSIETFWLPDTDADPKTGSGWVSGHQQSKSHSIPLRNGWFHITYTFTTKSDERTGYIRIDNNGSSVEGSAAIMKVTNLKLEKGPKESNYSMSPNEINLSIGDDCSGYNNHGTVFGSWTLDSDSPRHNCCTIFNGSDTKIELSTKALMQALLKDKCTINFWVNETNTGSRSVYFGGYSGSNFNIEMSGGKIRVYWNGSPDISTSSIVNNVWAMFTIVIDVKTGIKIYKDGVLEYTHSGALTDITTGFTNNIFRIGSDSRTGDTMAECKMSDFRIYCSSLSEEDIKTLYNSAGSVTKDGKLIVYDINEQIQSNAKIGKNGIFSAGGFSERGQLSNMKFTTLSDGSAWARVFYHKTNTGATLFTSIDEILYTTSEYKYSRLKLLPFLKGSDGKYEFMLTYPTDDPGKYNRWKQTNAPQNEFVATGDGSAFAAGYQGIHIDWNTYYWGGLTRQSSDASALVDTYLSGSVGHGNWFYAIGAKTKWGNPNGVPGYDGTKGMQEIELWVRVDTLPKNSKFNIMKEQFVSGTLFQEI